MGRWVPHDIRDKVIDYISYYTNLTGLPLARFIGWLGIGRGKYHEWHKRYGQGNNHNGLIPRSFWLNEWEKQAIIAFYLEHQEDGYRRVTFMMLDANIVAVSPSSVYRVLKCAELLRKWNRKKSKKGTGFHQPSAPHHHWHIDVSYINICGTFYYFCGVLDGYSRYIVHWEIRESMTEPEIEIIIQRAREKFPNTTPRIISDNGPQFIASDFKSYIKLCGMTHVRTSPFYPQSNGKLERFHATLKRECIRPKTPLSIEDALRVTGIFMDNYNNIRLHSAIRYISPRNKLEGRDQAIFADRKRKLDAAKSLRY
ncbi:MAG: DDE-type integrase/transposase/recombinase, partial [Mariprofundaceae bacterium]|nr:DDE-type integrase/transposase/recombinase [Mariprofundaceae bacterium]